MSDQGRPPTEEELRAAYEAELKQVRVSDVLAQTVVSLVNLGGRRAGLVPGAEDERDLVQLGQAVEGARALLPLCEAEIGPSAAGQIRQALSQLQMAYAQLSGQEPAEQPGAPPPSAGPTAAGPSGATPAPAPSAEPAKEDPVKSGRLWIPGQ